jgi:hypothetical protein
VTLPNDIAVQLNTLATDAYVDEKSQELVDGGLAQGVDCEAVEPVLRFMESHPTLDYGAPGALTHFIERFWRHGYEEKLLASVRRRPTEHTTWLLNRVINGEKDEAVRGTYIAVMRAIAIDAAIEEQARLSASQFLAGRPL